MNHWQGRDASTVEAACCEIDSLFVRCHEMYGYQSRVAALLAELRRRCTVPTLVATDLLCLLEYLVHPHFIADRSHWRTGFPFDASVWVGKGLFAAWQNVELVSMRVSDRAKYYCQVLDCWS